jgi:hypothetical protein
MTLRVVSHMNQQAADRRRQFSLSNLPRLVQLHRNQRTYRRGAFIQSFPKFCE